MSDESEIERESARAERLEHPERLPYRESWPAFSTVLRKYLIGTDQPAIVAKYFGLRRPQQVRDWRLGKAGIPAWVQEIARQRLQEAHAAALRELERVSPGPGYRADIHRKKKAPRLSGASRS